MRDLLIAFLREYPECNTIVAENIALIVDDNGNLTEDQIAAILIYLNGIATHRWH